MPQHTHEMDEGSSCKHSCIQHSAILPLLELLLLQTQVLRIRQVDEPCIGLTQENLIENSIQGSLPYILMPQGPC